VWKIEVTDKSTREEIAQAIRVLRKLIKGRKNDTGKNHKTTYSGAKGLSRDNNCSV